MHASIVNHYLEGGWYPEGGSGKLAEEICRTIWECGGAVLVGKNTFTISKILILKIKFIIDKTVNVENVPRAIQAEGTCTYIILTTSP